MTHRKNIQASEDHAQRTSCRTRAASACAGGLLAAPLLLSPLTDAAAEPTAPESPPNVLMIIVDDLRPELPAYGVDRVHSPNLDRLAGQSVVFERAYCQTPICGPSRASFLTGLRPEGNRFRTNQNRVNKQVPDAATIPGYFKEAGYTTRAFGKVFHSKSDMAQDWTIEQFDAPKTTPSWRRYQTEENIAIEEALAEGRRDRRGPAVEVAPDDATLRDTHTANAVIEQMRQQQEAGEPFMLAAGFYRPHLPFIAPQRDWDRYPAESIELPTSGIPKGAEPAAHNWGELRSYGDIPRKGPVSDEKAVELVRGYLASVTHVDREIGRVLDALDEMGIADDTIVVLFGDHGWFLRDHGLWCKHSTFHDALHVPLIVRAPGVQPARSDALVELVDVFPTLSELAGLPIHRQCEGNSFVPLLHDPQRSWKQAVFTRFMNQNTVVTQRYAYTQFRNKDTPMAYDLVEDPIETKNLALDPEHEDTIAELAETLEKGWRHFRPDNTPLDARVDDAAELLRVEAQPWDGKGTMSMNIGFSNDLLDGPVTIAVEPVDANPEGWRIDLGEGTLTVEPGETATLPIRVEHDPGSVRYPLPKLRCTVTLAPNGDRTETLHARSVLELPIVGSQPRLTLAPAPSPPSIDGKLDNAAWNRPADVPLLGRMQQEQPIRPTTRVWGSYDDEAIYLAFECDEPRAGKIKAEVEQRDGNVFQDDSVEVMLEPDGDGEGRDYFQIIVNAANVVFDGKGFDNSVDLDGLETATHVSEDAWTAEIAIPWKSLGLDGPPKQAGLLLARNRHAGGQHTIFQFPLSPRGNHGPGMFATLRVTE